MEKALFEINRETYDHHNPEKLKFKAPPGLNEKLVREISKDKNEPDWMLEKRLLGLKLFMHREMPDWGPDLSKLDLSNIIFYMKPDAKKNATSWDDVPEDIRKTYERLGIPEAEQKVLGGVGAQYESEVVYHNLRKDLEEKGVVFLDMDEALKQYPELVKEHFMTTCVPIGLHKFSALHAGCVEIHVQKNARARYSSIENWSRNTYNLNTKRALVYENGVVEWINGNMGSCVTMLYPASVLVGDRSKADFIGIAFAGKGQNQDTGSKVIHIGKDTSSTIMSKSISKDGGITSYRGLVSVKNGAKNAKANVQCDALMMDNDSSSNTFPYMDVQEPTTDLAHEATVGKISEEQIFYLTSRGLNEEQATQMIVSGFIEPIVKELPLEYAVELNRLIQLEMEGSLG